MIYRHTDGNDIMNCIYDIKGFSEEITARNAWKIVNHIAHPELLRQVRYLIRYSKDRDKLIENLYVLRDYVDVFSV